MKTSKLTYVVWVFFALTLATTTTFGQGRGNGNRYSHNQNCMQTIPGLTEKQQKQIQKMEGEHQQDMTALREKRRSTTDAIEKSEVRTKMLKKVDTHRKEVRAVLNEEQQKQYNQLHTYGNYGRNQNVGRGRANFNRSGNGNRNFAPGKSNFFNKGANLQQGYGRKGGNQGNFGRGSRRFSQANMCVNNRNIDTCGFRAIPEKEFK